MIATWKTMCPIFWGSYTTVCHFQRNFLSQKRLICLHPLFTLNLHHFAELYAASTHICDTISKRDTASVSL